ncbi:MAG: precorrin-2 dehydrogenase/sirohydrochlorin ferrochelatase family protein [Candidatus Acidiferrales bacterium]
MDLFPLFLKIAGRRCLVAGAGRVAEEKIEGLLRGGAIITVIAPRATARVRKWAREGKIRWHARGYRSGDLARAFLVVAATSSAELHQRIFHEATARSVLCNIVDDPPHCDFYYGSVVRRGALQIAISTAGRSPALAQRLRKELSKQFGAEFADWVSYLGAEREKLMHQKISPQRRKQLLHRLASRAAFEKFKRKARR